MCVSVMVIVGEFVGGAALGAAFGVLCDVVREAMNKPTPFKSLLNNINSTLGHLQPVIERIGEHEVELGQSDWVIKCLIKQVKDGVLLVQKSSKVSKWNCIKSYNYTEQLIELDGSLKRSIEILKVEGVRDVKETLVLTRKNNVRLNESAKDRVWTKKLLTQIVRLVSCTCRDKFRHRSRNRVSKASRRRGRRRRGISEASNLRVFRLAELKAATGNFRPDVSRLEKGRFGTFVKGKQLGTGITVDVNILCLYPQSMQGVQEWESEVNFLGRLSHPNLVQLLGYCNEEGERFFVYEFVPNRSLHHHLFGYNPDEEEPLSWDNRLKIAVGAAQGLNYLHSLQTQIIHRHVKPSYILLDENYNAKLSDLYLAKWGPYDESSGTLGYDAPEYFKTGRDLCVKSDVYSFGVVLLQILTGLEVGVYDFSHPEAEIDLVCWAIPLLSDETKLQTIMDARIKGQYSSQEALQTAHLTLKCLQLDPQSRPSMAQVVDELQHIQAKTNHSKLDTECDSHEVLPEIRTESSSRNFVLPDVRTN